MGCGARRHAGRGGHRLASRVLPVAGPVSGVLLAVLEPGNWLRGRTRRGGHCLQTAVVALLPRLRARTHATDRTDTYRFRARHIRSNAVIFLVVATAVEFGK